LGWVKKNGPMSISAEEHSTLECLACAVADCITSTSSKNNRYDNYGRRDSAILHTQNWPACAELSSTDQKWRKNGRILQTFLSAVLFQILQ